MTHIFPWISTSTFKQAHTFQKSSFQYYSHFFNTYASAFQLWDRLIYLKSSNSTLTHIFQYISTSTFRQAQTSQKIQLPMLLTFFHTSAFQLSDRLIHFKKLSFHYDPRFSIYQHFNFQTGLYISKNSSSNVTTIFPQISISTFRQAHTFQ